MQTPEDVESMLNELNAKGLTDHVPATARPDSVSTWDAVSAKAKKLLGISTDEEVSRDGHASTSTIELCCLGLQTYRATISKAMMCLPSQSPFFKSMNRMHKFCVSSLCAASLGKGLRTASITCLMVNTASVPPLFTCSVCLRL